MARSLGLASSKEWKVLCKKGMCPPNVPSTSGCTYKDRGWQGWAHWLGAGNLRKKDFLPFDEALCLARSLRLVSQEEWFA